MFGAALAPCARGQDKKGNETESADHFMNLLISKGNSPAPRGAFAQRTGNQYKDRPARRPQARRDSKIDWTSAAKDSLLWVPAGGLGHPVKHSGLASRCAGLWVVRASIPAPRTNGAQTMSALSIKSRNTKSAAPKKGSAQSKTASRRKVTSPAANAKKPTRSVESKAERVAAAKTLRKADEPKVERVTKQEHVLTLLSQPNGASIEEMMLATDWQTPRAG